MKGGQHAKKERPEDAKDLQSHMEPSVVCRNVGLANHMFPTQSKFIRQTQDH